MAGIIGGDPEGIETVATNLKTPESLRTALERAKPVLNMPSCPQETAGCQDFTTACKEAAGHAERLLAEVETGFEAYRTAITYTATDYAQADDVSARAFEAATARNPPPEGATAAINDEIERVSEAADEGGS